MSDNHWRYRSIKQAFRQLMPNAGKELDILAALVSGIVGSKSTHYSHIASKVPNHIKLESRVKSYSRWVNDVEEKQEVYVMPFAPELLFNLTAVQTLAFVIDGSEVGRKCLVLTINVVYRSRALPIAWIVVKGSKGHFPEDTHVKLVQKVHEMVPEGSEVVFLGDGEFDGTVLQAELHAYHWRYACRTASNTILSKNGAECAYQDLPLQAGECWSLADVSFTRKCYGPVMAIGWWRKGYQEPIYLVTNFDTAAEACHWYQKRFHIETFFSDQKSRGFHLHKSHIAYPARLARLMLAACLAYVWIVCLGALAMETGLHRIIHRTDRCDLSLFQLGFRVLDYIMDNDLPLPVMFISPEYASSEFVR
jgi:Transposase DDE domain